MRFYILFLMAALFTPMSLAQTTGAFDAQMLKQLLIQVEQLHEQIDTMTESLDVSKRMEEYEQLKTIKKLSNEGKALRALVYELDEIERDIYGFRDDPLGLSRPNDELTWLREAMADARDNPNAAKAYGSILIDLKTLSFLGKAQKESQKRVVDGLNQEDAGQVTSVNTMIMSEILINNERIEAAKRANNTNIVTEILGSSSYDMLTEESE